MADRETTLSVVDGRDALAYLIIKPNERGDGVVIDAAANGMSHAQAAYVLRHVAGKWDPQAGPAPVPAEVLVEEQKIAEELIREAAREVSQARIRTRIAGLAGAPTEDQWRQIHAVEGLVAAASLSVEFLEPSDA